MAHVLLVKNPAVTVLIAAIHIDSLIGNNLL